MQKVTAELKVTKDPNVLAITSNGVPVCWVRMEEGQLHKKWAPNGVRRRAPFIADKTMADLMDIAKKSLTSRALTHNAKLAIDTFTELLSANEIARGLVGLEYELNSRGVYAGCPVAGSGGWEVYEGQTLINDDAEGNTSLNATLNIEPNQAKLTITELGQQKAYPIPYNEQFFLEIDRLCSIATGGI